MQELLKGIEGINKYNLSEPKKSLFLAMVINSFIILRKVDYNLIDLIQDKIYQYEKIDNFNKDSAYIELIYKIIDYIYSLDKKVNDNMIGKMIVNNYFINGYGFHAFNAGLYNEISKNGLLVKDKLIDTNLFYEVDNIFKKRNAMVFGLYKPEDNNSIFFAGTLNNIYQYGAGSPSFFRKFIFQSDKEDNYLKRNYDKCLESVLNTIKKYNLNENEKQIVLEFFDKYYQLFSTNDYYVALYPLKRNINTDYTKEDIKRLFKEELSYNYRVYDDIKPNDLILISSNIFDNKVKRK